jgi:hypothetical protein
MDRILDIFFVPPLAIARLGSSDQPLEAFDWVEDTASAGGARTTIAPAATLLVSDEGEVSAYLPSEIRFKDEGNRIRPVAPFFELWATLQSQADGSRREVPLTGSMLKEMNIPLDAIRYTVIAGNNKAQSRTNAAETSFRAEVDATAADHSRKTLAAISPHTADQEPLVLPDKPIPLGSFQVMRPRPETEDIGGDQVNLDILRVRYTPARGEVYGPPGTISGPASPLQPGEADPALSLEGRIHEIVPEKNRFLNPKSKWSQFAYDTPPWQPDSPIDAYDGANVGNNQSWGVVDDTCDLMITVNLAFRGQNFTSQARAFVGPPAYAPDRRPFYAVSDELADRELPAVPVDPETFEESTEEVVDLFARILETASTVNLDAHRSWALTVNASKVGTPLPNNPGWDARTDPKIGPASMTAKDQPYVDVTPTLAPGQPESMFNSWNRTDRLPYKQVVDFVHAPLADRAVLLSFLRRRGDHVRKLVRKPLGRVRDLPPRTGIELEPEWRDPREIKERLYDMKMPPYMRHSMGYPLTLSIRQYQFLMDYIALLEAGDGEEDDA